MLKRLRDKIKLTPLISLAFSIVALIVILSVINGAIAAVVFTSAGFVIYLLDKVKPELVDSAIIKWNNFSTLVHVGLVVFILASIIYLFRLFIKGYRIQIIKLEP